MRRITLGSPQFRRLRGPGARAAAPAAAAPAFAALCVAVAPAAATLFVAVVPVQAASRFGDGFWKHWGDGRAEVASYDLTYPRYGELRSGTAVTVFVTEPI